MKSNVLFFSFILFFYQTAYSQLSSQIEISRSVPFVVDSKPYDLDNDGLKDILSASGYKITWYKNLGSGLFSSQKLISSNTPEASSATSVISTDLNNDGLLDVIYTSGADDKIAWYKNLGQGNFGQEIIISLSADGASCSYASDLDNDGDMDIITSSILDNKIAWYENLDNGTFSGEMIISTNALQARSVFAADINNDGNIDVLSASRADDKVAWYPSLGDGTFDSEQIISTTCEGVLDVHSADLDNDGDMDVLAAVYGDNNVVWFENYGNSTFSQQQIINSNASGAHSVFTRDINNDGNLDVFFTSSIDEKVGWHENLSTSSFGSENLIATNLIDPTSIIVSDLDNDGEDDVIVASSGDDKISWFKNLSNATFDLGTTINTTANGPSSVTYADLDQDGDMDIIACLLSQGTVVWYENLGANSFAPQSIISTNTQGATCAISYDIENDGDMDIICASSFDDKISLFENLGSAIFSPEQIITTATDRVYSIHYSDLDNDGDFDLISASKDDNKIAWYENIGNGTFGTQQIVTELADNAISVYSGDIDNDGLIDILSASQNDNTVAWYKNLGAGIFGSEQVLSSNIMDAYAVRCADLDNDGDLDVISCSYTDDYIVWFENFGSAVFSPGEIISTLVNSPSYLEIADINGDGLIDILSASSHDDKIAWYTNLDNGNFSTQKIISDRANFANSIAVTDLDKDGDLEILSTSRDDDKIAYYENYFTSKNYLKGTIYYDLNQNGHLDSTESGFNLTPTTLTPNGLAAFTNLNGNYHYAVDTGTYTISPNINNSWNLTSDSVNYTRSITHSIPTVDSLNFGYYPNIIETEIETNLTGGFPRCNSIINYWVNIKNIGTTIPSGIIHLELDNQITFISCELTPDSIIGQNLYWHYDSLLFYSIEEFRVVVQMPPFIALNFLLSSVLTVSELNNSDITIYSISEQLDQVSACAYDPNDKSVIPIGLGNEGYINKNETLEYLIRFQNTGTDTAFTILVRDQLDPNLNWNSIHSITSSHAMQTWIEQDGELVFKFENIMLPDSNINELASHGYIKFKIDQQLNLNPETQIFNTGHIYFDSNPAIITNTVLNTIYNCNSTNYNLTNTTLCLGDTLQANSINGNFNTTIWELNTLFSDTLSQLNWPSDTSGTFDLTLKVVNELCTIDSTQIVTINPSYYYSEQTNICEGDSAFFFGEYHNTPGEYTNNHITVNGCDSIYSNTLTINNYNFHQDIQICQGDSVLIYGDYQNTTNYYFDSLQTISGCDSIFSTNLLVTPLPQVNIDNFSDDTVCSNIGEISLPASYPNGGVYSENGINILSFNSDTATIGSHTIFYHYEDIDGCLNQDSTTITVFDCLSIQNHLDKIEINIIPNPSSGLFKIELGKLQNVSIIVYSVRGSIIFEDSDINSPEYELELNEAPAGVYFIEISQSNDKKRFKLILE